MTEPSTQNVFSGMHICEAGHSPTTPRSFGPNLLRSGTHSYQKTIFKHVLRESKKAVEFSGLGFLVRKKMVK